MICQPGQSIFQDAVLDGHHLLFYNDKHIYKFDSITQNFTNMSVPKRIRQIISYQGQPLIIAENQVYLVQNQGKLELLQNIIQAQEKINLDQLIFIQTSNNFLIVVTLFTVFSIDKNFTLVSQISGNFENTVEIQYFNQMFVVHNYRKQTRTTTFKLYKDETEIDISEIIINDQQKDQLNSSQLKFNDLQDEKHIINRIFVNENNNIIILKNLNQLVEYDLINQQLIQVYDFTSDILLAEQQTPIQLILTTSTDLIFFDTSQFQIRFVLKPQRKLFQFYNYQPVIMQNSKSNLNTSQQVINSNESINIIILKVSANNIFVVHGAVGFFIQNDINNIQQNINHERLEQFFDSTTNKSKVTDIVEQIDNQQQQLLTQYNHELVKKQNINIEVTSHFLVVNGLFNNMQYFYEYNSQFYMKPYNTQQIQVFNNQFNSRNAKFINQENVKLIYKNNKLFIIKNNTDLVRYQEDKLITELKFQFSSDYRVEGKLDFLQSSQTNKNQCFIANMQSQIIDENKSLEQKHEFSIKDICAINNLFIVLSDQEKLILYSYDQYAAQLTQKKYVLQEGIKVFAYRDQCVVQRLNEIVIYNQDFQKVKSIKFQHGLQQVLIHPSKTYFITRTEKTLQLFTNIGQDLYECGKIQLQSDGDIQLDSYGLFIFEQYNDSLIMRKFTSGAIAETIKMKGTLFVNDQLYCLSKYGIFRIFDHQFEAARSRVRDGFVADVFEFWNGVELLKWGGK